MKLDDAVRQAEDRAKQLRDAIDELESAAIDEIGEAPHVVGWLKKNAADLTFDAVRRSVAEARRPKGPTVNLEFATRFQHDRKDPQPVEVIRRTATQALVRRNPENGYYARDEYYKLDTGWPVKRQSDRFSGNWRIREADLETIRAMPIGENAVSRALKAIESGEQKP
jgi:hypothetical protein